MCPEDCAKGHCGYLSEEPRRALGAEQDAQLWTLQRLLIRAVVSSRAARLEMSWLERRRLE